MPADLDDTAVARPVPAGHRRFSGELRTRDTDADRIEHRLRAAGEHVAGIVGQQLGHEPWLDHDLRVREERRRVRVLGRPEPEHDRWISERLGRYGNGAIPIPPPTSSGRATSRSKPFPSGPKTWSCNARLERAQSACTRPDRVDEEGELARRRQAEAHRPRQEPARRLEHEELPGRPWVDGAALEPEQRVRADRLPRDDAEELPRRQGARLRPPGSGDAHASIPIRSWSESADSARAFAMACTAAAAPEIVVTHGTRATSAASRMR